MYTMTSYMYTMTSYLIEESVGPELGGGVSCLPEHTVEETVHHRTGCHGDDVPERLAKRGELCRGGSCRCERERRW